MTATPCDLVQCSDPLGDPRWDLRLESCEGASFFHSTAWARVLHETYGYEPIYFSAQNEDSSSIVVPVMEIKSWLTGCRGVTLPFTDECEALCASPELFRVMFRQLLSFANSRRWKYYELRGGRPTANDAPPSISFYGHRLTLGEDAETLFSRCESAVRRGVRKAEQEGVTVEFSHHMPAVRQFYNLLCKTRDRHGLPPQPFRFFENIHRHILQMGKGRIALAVYRGLPVAGAVFFHFGRNVLYKFAASDETFQHLRGNNLVLWKSIESYVRRGFSNLDFGRTSLPNSGLRRFKLSWGTTERKIEYLRYSRQESAFVRSTDQSLGSWHTSFFRSLPGGLSRLIGAAAYRHLA